MNGETISRNDKINRWGLVGTLVWGIIIITVFILVQLVATGFYIGINYGEVSSSEQKQLLIDLQNNGAVLSLCTFVAAIICSILIFGIIKLMPGSDIRAYLGFNNVELKKYFYWLFILVIFIVLSDLLTTVLGRPVVPEFMFSVYTSIDNVWILCLAIIIAAPFFEELFFRGFLFSGLSETSMGTQGTVFFTSLLWAGIHFQYDYYDLFIILLIGLILGTARLKTGSVILTIVMHAFINLVAIIETMIYVSLPQA